MTWAAWTLECNMGAVNAVDFTKAGRVGQGKRSHCSCCNSLVVPGTAATGDTSSPFKGVEKSTCPN